MIQATLATLLLRPHLATGGQILTPDVAVERLSVVTGGEARAVPLARIITAPPLALGGTAYRCRAALALAGADGRHFLMPACVVEAETGDPDLALLAGQVVVPRRAVVLEEVEGEAALAFSGGGRQTLEAAGAARAIGESWPLRKGSLVVLAAPETHPLVPGELTLEFSTGGDTWRFLLAVERAAGAL